MAEYWGRGTIHFLALTLYNFKNVGGGHFPLLPPPPSPLPPSLRGPCNPGKFIGLFIVVRVSCALNGVSISAVKSYI